MKKMLIMIASLMMALPIMAQYGRPSRMNISHQPRLFRHLAHRSALCHHWRQFLTKQEARLHHESRFLLDMRLIFCC